MDDSQRRALAWPRHSVVQRSMALQSRRAKSGGRMRALGSGGMYSSLSQKMYGEACKRAEPQPIVATKVMPAPT